MFASDVHGEIALEDSLDIDTDVGIKGPGAGVLTVRRAERRGGRRSPPTVTITGLTIAGGETAVELEAGQADPDRVRRARQHAATASPTAAAA